MGKKRCMSDPFEKVYVSSDMHELKRDVILLPPRSLCELQIHCSNKKCNEKINILLRTPQSQDGCFISTTPLLDYFNRPTNRTRTKMYSIRDMKMGSTDVIQYCSREGALWISVEFVDLQFPPNTPVFQQVPYEVNWGSEDYSPKITFLRQDLSADVSQYTCNMCGKTDQVIFTIERKVIRENLLIRELKC